MKYFMTPVLLLISLNTFACPDIAGSYKTCIMPDGAIIENSSISMTNNSVTTNFSNDPVTYILGEATSEIQNVNNDFDLGDDDFTPVGHAEKTITVGTCSSESFTIKATTQVLIPGTNQVLTEYDTLEVYTKVGDELHVNFQGNYQDVTVICK